MKNWGIAELGDQALTLADNVHVRAVAVLFAAYIAARIVDSVASSIVSRLVRRTATELDDQISAILHVPVHYSILLIGAGAALRLENFPDPTGFALLALVKSAFVLLWMFGSIRIAVLVLEWASRHPTRFQVVQPSTLPVFDIVAKVTLVGGTVYFLLVSWSVDPTGWAASAGIIGLAVGFAAKDTLANLFAGVFILADAPYKVGDYIELDGQRGLVTRIGLRSTRILTRDDVEITIPNSIIAATKIVNESGGPHVKSRIRAATGVAYGSDVDLLRKVLLEVAHGNQVVCKDPEPRVRFRGFGDSSLNFELLCWIDDPQDRGRVQDQLYTEIYKALGRSGIEIPFPKRDVYIRQIPAGFSLDAQRTERDAPGGNP